MRRNTEMYGSVNMDALAADVVEKIKTGSTSMALIIAAMVATAQELMPYDITAADQTLNRVQFLIHRCCPMLHPEVPEELAAAA